MRFANFYFVTKLPESRATPMRAYSFTGLPCFEYTSFQVSGLLSTSLGKKVLKLSFISNCSTITKLAGTVSINAWAFSRSVVNGGITALKPDRR